MTAAGHLSTAFLLRSKFKKVPFWVLLIASEAIEIVWLILNLNLIALVEPLEITKINLPFLYIGDMILYQQIVSHSLLGAFAISLMLAFVFKFWKRIDGIFLAVFLGAFGHWCLDLLVHDADLSIFISLNSTKVGPLLNFDSTHPTLGFFTTAPILGFCFQSLFSFFCAFLYFKSFPIHDLKKKQIYWILIFLVNISILGIFVKGALTWVIKSPTIMVIMVLFDILASGIMLFVAHKMTEIQN